MVRLSFENLRFREMEDNVRVSFLNIYSCYLPKKDLRRIGKFKVEPHAITFQSTKKEGNVQKKFSYILDRAFDDLHSTVNNKPALYIHRHSGIPLIGSNAFGVIDRGTNTIEVKPLTTCNIDCIFCSVDHTKRLSDIVVEKDYLFDELKQVIDIKKHRVNIHIGSQGDPSLYGDLIELVRDIRSIDKVDAISMVTNGLLITKKVADRLIEAGMTHFHISLHTIDEEMGDKLANVPYPVGKVMELCRHLAASSAHLLLVPVLVPGVNDDDIKDVIRFGKEIGATIGVQNFLEYKYGKKPAKPLPMDIFMKRLHEYEEEFDIDLTSLGGDLKIVKDTELKKPFVKGDIIEVDIVAQDRLQNSMIGVARDRVVTVINGRPGKNKVKLIRDKDNIFVGVLA